MSYEEKIKIYQSMIRNLEKELKHYEGTPYFEDEEFKIREKINMHKEELRLYAQADKADEYEAKAKAFDHVENLVRTELTSDDLYHDARDNDYAAGMLRVYEMVDYIIEKYESGEYDD